MATVDSVVKDQFNVSRGNICDIQDILLKLCAPSLCLTALCLSVHPSYLRLILTLYEQHMQFTHVVLRFLMASVTL